MTRTPFVTLLVALSLAAAGCGSHSDKTSSAPQPKLTNLHSIGQLQAAFNTASNEPRLVMLVSPT